MVEAGAAEGQVGGCGKGGGRRSGGVTLRRLVEADAVEAEVGGGRHGRGGSRRQSAQAGGSR